MRKWFCCLNRAGTRSRSHNSAGDDFFARYDAKLHTAKLLAYITNVTYSLTWFLGFCALTWASAVILGGLLTSLSKHDYYSVVVLLLLEAIRLSAATFFGKVMTSKLVKLSADPNRLVYHDSQRQVLQNFVRILEHTLELTFIAIAIVLPARRIQHLARSPLSSDEDFDGLQTSLHIFYALVLVNGVIAGLAVMFSMYVVPHFVNSTCLHKYYQKVVWKGMDEGLLHGGDFQFFSWTFQMLADEYRRNTRALMVKQLYEGMMTYLYYHPRHKGFEAAKVALESEDTYEREAAANIVGSWVSIAMELEDSKDKSALNRLRMQTKLLSKLAEALDNEETGRAATSSFMKLAEIDPDGVLRVRSEGKDEKLADILMDRVHQTVTLLEKPNNAIIYIKAMIPLLSYLESHGLHRCMMMTEAGDVQHELGKYCTQEKLLMLKEDLWTIVTKYASGLKRLQAVAAHAYYLLLSEDRRRSTDLRTHLRIKPKAKEEHILEDELQYLLLYLEADELPKEWGNAVRKRSMKNDKEALPWLAMQSTALIASLVVLVILVLSSACIMRYAHF